jgi:hypothetical protein
VNNSQHQLAQRNKVIVMVGSWLPQNRGKERIANNLFNLAAVIHHNTTDGDFVDESGYHSLHTHKFCVICDYEFGFWRSRI